MNKSMLFIVSMFMMAVMAMPAYAFTYTFQIDTRGYGLWDATYFDTTVPTGVNGDKDYMYLGNISVNRNFSIFLKYNINTSMIPAGSTIQSAILNLHYKACPDLAGGIANQTVRGLQNQTWTGADMTYNMFYSNVDVAAANTTVIFYNDTYVCGAANTWMFFNVTSWVQWAYDQSYDNVSFYINRSFQDYKNYRGRFEFYTGLTTTQYSPQLNVTVLTSPIIITSPSNTTYYNNFTLPLNVSNNTFNADKWFYSLNNGSNISFTPNTTITKNSYGSNCIDVWVNGSSNNWFTQQVCWTNSPYPQTGLVTVCNSSNVNKWSCAADGFSILQCIQMTYTSYQWDASNITNCPYGCWNGACLTPSKTCQDACINATTKCIDNNNYATCHYNSVSGCHEWGGSIFCVNGCSEGACAGVPNECQPFTMKCQNSKYIVWCLNEDNTDVWKWSRINRTVCEFQCVENLTASKVDAYCTAHSITDEMYALRNLANYYMNGIRYAADKNLRILLPISLFLSIIAGIVVGYLLRNKMLAVITMGLAFFIFSAIGWIPWPVTIIFIIIAGFIIFKTAGGDEE